jgi:hypothetical protein
MKAHWGNAGIAPRILDLGTGWRWVVSFTPRIIREENKIVRGKYLRLWKLNISNSHSSSQKIPYLLRKPSLNYRYHSNPPLNPLLSDMNPVQILTPHFLKFRLHIILVLLNGNFRPKYCTHFSFLPCMLHVIPISSSLIWSPLGYLVKRTNY